MLAIGTIRNVLKQAWCLAFTCSEHTTAGKFLAHQQATHLPFEVTAEQAKKRFAEWNRSKWLSPRNLLSEGKFTVRPLLMPYWIFSIEASIKYSGTVSNPNSKQNNSVKWQRVDWTTESHKRYEESETEMQVYASYQYRRDFAETVKAGAKVKDLQLIQKAQAHVGELHFPAMFDEPVQLQIPEMRKSLAWEFALRAAHESETDICTRMLQEEYKTSEVNDVDVVISPTFRNARLVYVPAYAIDYTYGETFNVHGERHPEHFCALVSALENGGVGGVEHVSVHKAALMGGSATLGFMASTSTLAAVVGADPISWSSLDYMFSSLSIGGIAGLIAQLVPSMNARRAEQQWVAAEGVLQAAVGSISKAQIVHFENDPNEGLRRGMEWLRWEEADKHSWDSRKRQRWAENLWQAQVSRKIQWRRAKQQADRLRKTREAEELREQRRHARWGPSSRARHANLFTGGRRGGGSSDYFGYYQALGLDPAMHPVSQEDIKKGFIKAALRWHPDRHGDESSKHRARDRFQMIRVAYETLRDPEKRKSYDLGELRLHEDH